MQNIPRSGWTLDHVGHAVRDLRAAEQLYTQKLGFTEELRETLPQHLVETIFVRSGDALVELLSPLPGNSTLTKFLEKRGDGLHHLALRVDSVTAELNALAAAGFELIDHAPRIGARNLAVAFVHPRSCGGVLLELCGAL